MARLSDKENNVKCPVCKGTVEERLITYIQEYKGRVIIVENVLAEVCKQCGEKLLRPEIAKQIQTLVWESPAPTRKTEVPVYDLAEVA